MPRYPDASSSNKKEDEHCPFRGATAAGGSRGLIVRYVAFREERKTSRPPREREYLQRWIEYLGPRRQDGRRLDDGLASRKTQAVKHRVLAEQKAVRSGAREYRIQVLRARHVIFE